MAKYIKLWDGIRITTADASIVCKTPDELWQHIHVDDECKTIIMKELYCFGRFDLTEACGGKMCILSIVRNDEES